MLAYERERRAILPSTVTLQLEIVFVRTISRNESPAREPSDVFCRWITPSGYPLVLRFTANEWLKWLSLFKWSRVLVEHTT